MSDIIDVEARVIATETEAPAADSPATPVDVQLLDPEKVVPALVAKQELEKLNPAIIAMNRLKARIAAELPTLDVNTKEGEERARELRRLCVSLRTSTKKTYEAWNKPILEAQRGARAVLEQVEAGIADSEKQVDDLIKAKEAAAAAEKARLQRLEEERIAAIGAKMDAFAAAVVAAVSMDAAAIDEKIRELQDLVITDAADSFAEFADQAGVLRANAISQLLEMAKTKREQEQRQAELAAEARRQAEERQRQVAEQALRNKINAWPGLAMSALGKPSTEIQKILDTLTQQEPGVEFGDLHAEASTAFVAAKVALEHALSFQQKMEQQQADQERIAAEQREQQARLDEQQRQQAQATIVVDESTMPAGTIGDGSLDTAIAVHPALPVETAQELVEREEFRLAACDIGLANQDEYVQVFGEPNYMADPTFRVEMPTPGDVTGYILETLSQADLPDEYTSELRILNVLLDHSIRAAMQMRYDALLASANEKVPA